MGIKNPNYQPPATGLPYYLANAANAANVDPKTTPKLSFNQAKAAAATASDPAVAASTAATPAAQSMQQSIFGGYNPLALNLMYSQAIAPMMQKLGGQLLQSNTDLEKAFAPSTNPLASHVPAAIQDIFNQQNMRASEGNNNLVASLMQAAPAAAGVDAITKQDTATRTLAQQLLQKMMYLENNSGSLGGNPLATPATGTTGTQTGAQMVDAFTKSLNPSG